MYMLLLLERQTREFWGIGELWLGSNFSFFLFQGLICKQNSSFHRYYTLINSNFKEMIRILKLKYDKLTVRVYVEQMFTSLMNLNETRD